MIVPCSMMIYDPITGMGTAKGLRAVFKERGYSDQWLHKKTLDQLVAETQTNPDFVDFTCSTSIIQDIIHAHNPQYRCLYLPKFHCELNPIEVRWYRPSLRGLAGGSPSDDVRVLVQMTWGRAKFELGSILTGKFEVLQQHILEEYRKVTSNLTLADRWFKRMFRYLDAYGSGMNQYQAEQCMKGTSSRAPCGGPKLSHARSPSSAAALCVDVAVEAPPAPAMI